MGRYKKKKKKAETYPKAGDIIVKRYGQKARAKALAAVTPNEEGFLTIPAYTVEWEITTAKGPYGEFTKFGDQYLSVNKRGNIWARVDSPKADVFKELVKDLIYEMIEKCEDAGVDVDDEDLIDSVLSGEDISWDALRQHVLED